MKIVLATNNKGKVKEIKELLSHLPIDWLSLDQFDSITEVVEDGDTFLDNAVLKAKGYAKQTGELCLADDSGLCVDYLKGAPGVYSARYAGEEGDPYRNCQKVLEKMKGCPPKKRQAYFIAVLALAKADELIYSVEGRSEGLILDEMKGREGFGYDPIFFSAKYQKSFAELTPDEKNAVSHRGKALKKMEVFLRELVRKS